MRPSFTTLIITLVIATLCGCSASSDTPNSNGTSKFNGTIAGTVRTYIRDTLLAGVTVSAIDTTTPSNSRSVTTVSDGKYNITATTGNYLLVASKAGFRPD